MPAPHTRPIVGCIFSYEGKVLLSEGSDTITDEKFYRIIGGGIEFGETSEQALRREIQEELGADITALQFIGVSENIFTHNGQPGHELFFCYDASFVDLAWYTRSDIMCDRGLPNEQKAVWVPIADIVSGAVTVYPVGIREWLANPQSPRHVIS